MNNYLVIKIKTICTLLFVLLLFANCTEDNSNQWLCLNNVPQSIKLNTSYTFEFEYYSKFTYDQTGTIAVLKYDDDVEENNYIDYSHFDITKDVGQLDLTRTFNFPDTKYEFGTYKVILKGKEGSTVSKPFDISAEGGSTDIINFSEFYLEKEFTPGYIGDGSTKFKTDINFDIATFVNNNSFYNDDIVTIGCSFVDGDKKYEFNRVEYTISDISSLNPLTVSLEYGGPLPCDFGENSNSVDIKLKAEIYKGRYYEVGDFNQTKVYKDDIRIYDFDETFVNTLELEYDCVSEADFLSDAGNFNDVKNALETSFLPANIKLDIFPRNGYLDHDEKIKENELWDFARINDMDLGTGADEHPHILFFKRLLNIENEPLETPGSSTSSLKFDGYWHRYSYIFLEGQSMDYQRVRLKAIVHELGHQMAALFHASGANTHPENHNSPFCTMNQGGSFRTYSEEGSVDNDDNSDNNTYNPTWNFDFNPHFCDKCLQTLKENCVNNWYEN